MHLIPRVESITDESLESNCSIIENIPPKGESFSDLIATFAMSVGFDTHILICHTKIGEKFDMTGQLFVAQVLKKLNL